MRRNEAGGTVAKVVLGVVVGLFLFVIACSALISQGAKEVDKDRSRPATMSIETAAETCWLLTIGGSDGSRQEEGCGPRQVAMPAGFAASATVTKRSGTGDLTAVLAVEGKETKRQTTNADYGSVTVSR